MSGSMQVHGELQLRTPGPALIDVTAQVLEWLRAQQAEDGLLTLFIRHTSASLTIQENADPDVLDDLIDSISRLAPRNAGYRHDTEGPDDMPAHVKAALTATSLSVPVVSGRPVLGTWQGIYVWEHRDSPHHRRVALHFIGDVAA